MKRILPLLLALALSACASTPSAPVQEASVAAADTDVVCERETPTGTSLPTKRCRSAVQREADRRAVDAVEADARLRAGQTTTGKAGP